MIGKKILIHSIVFSPDCVSTAYLYNDIALGLKNVGLEVVVITTTPHYNLIEDSLSKQPLIKKFYGLFYESNFHGIRVIHVSLKKYKSIFVRILSFLYWHIVSLIIGLCLKNLNYILSPSPPLSIGFISIIIGKIKKAKFIYNVQEIYPDILIKQGGLKSNLLIKILKWLEKFVYNNADSVITIDKIFYNQIVDRFIDKSKLIVIPNFVDTDLYRPINSEIILPEPFINDNTKFKLLYAGNIGYYQDWEPILYAADKLRGTNIEFWIIGEGVNKNQLIKEIEKNSITNIHILPYQNRDLMPVINTFADVHFISINKDMENEGFPSKVYTIMACAKPMIIVTGLNTPIYNFLNNLDCAILISENKNEIFYKSIVEISNDKNRLRDMGKNAYNIIIENYTKDIIIKKYVNLFESI